MATRTVITIVLALVLSGCTKPPVMSAAEITWRMQWALATWYEQVGYMRPIDWHWDSGPPPRYPRVVRGETLCVNNYRRIVIYLQAVQDPMNFVSAVLHELGHAHLSCSDADHVDDQKSIMHPATSRIRIDALTLHELQPWRPP